MFYKIAKRFFDVALSIIALIGFLPLFVITAVLIYISDPGPIIFKSNRVGKNGETFIMYKFRSMYQNDRKTPLITLQDDDRIFPFGKIIRKTKIDELPQLINILEGSMSIVGWRPETPDNIDIVFDKGFDRILSIKPGLTSPASLYDYTHGEKCVNEEVYKNEFLENKLMLELYYVDHQSIGYDLSLIMRTIKTIILMIMGVEHFPLPIEFQWN